KLPVTRGTEFNLRPELAAPGSGDQVV
ncbi:uncharacterized protein METZ01_LOCUS506337, partial [marine metagenome]